MIKNLLISMLDKSSFNPDAIFFASVILYVPEKILILELKKATIGIIIIL